MNRGIMNRGSMNRGSMIDGRRNKSPRRGYAMVLVLVFLALMLSLHAVVVRNLGAGLRIEKVRVLQQQRDEGSMEALARAVSLLETGLPPTDPYVCETIVSMSGGDRAFTVTYTTELDASVTISVAPTVPPAAPDPMPTSF